MPLSAVVSSASAKPLVPYVPATTPCAVEVLVAVPTSFASLHPSSSESKST